MNASASVSTNNFSISADQLGKRFNREWIFRNLSFTLTSEQSYAIVGPNGSGKSTLLQILWGQMIPSKGNVSYQKNGKQIPIEDVYKSVCVATPYLDLVDEFTLQEIVRFHFKMKRPRNGLTNEDIIKAMYLDGQEGQFIGNFSSGMKQRLKLGLAFFSECDCIFLDEPGTNLDRRAFDWYLENLRQLPDNCLTIIASNQPAEYPADAVKVDITAFK